MGERMIVKVYANTSFIINVCMGVGFIKLITHENIKIVYRLECKYIFKLTYTYAISCVWMCVFACLCVCMNVSVYLLLIDVFIYL